MAYDILSLTDDGDGTITLSWSAGTIGSFSSGPSNLRLAVSRIGGRGAAVSRQTIELGGHGFPFAFPAATFSPADVIPAGLYTGQIEAYGNSPLAGMVWQVGPPYLFRVNDGTLARETRCRIDVMETIRLLALPEIGDKVLSQLEFDATEVKSFPCVVCLVLGQTETDEQMLSSRDDTGYPVLVMICDRRGHRDHKRLPFYEMTRQRIQDAFRNQQLMVPESLINRIEQDPIIDLDDKKYQTVASAFVIRCVFRHGRGIS